jgi:tail assembly chaperone E/41/14-like protein
MGGNMDDITKRHDALKPEPPPQPQPQPQPVPTDEEAPNYTLNEEYVRQPTPEEEAVNDPCAHPLTKPIDAHSERITILRWREPTGLDIEKAGNPIQLETSPDGERMRIAFDERKMGAMIVQLAQIPPSSVRMMAARDWNAVAIKIFRFFL